MLVPRAGRRSRTRTRCALVLSRIPCVGGAALEQLLLRFVRDSSGSLARHSNSAGRIVSVSRDWAIASPVAVRSFVSASAGRLAHSILVEAGASSRSLREEGLRRVGMPEDVLVGLELEPSARFAAGPVLVLAVRTAPASLPVAVHETQVRVDARGGRNAGHELRGERRSAECAQAVSSETGARVGRSEAPESEAGTARER